MYLPKYSYFGDYQILLNLKSNLEFRTHLTEGKTVEETPDILFMCCDSEVLMNLCELFPQTCQNITRRSEKRRNIFLKQKRTKSVSWKAELKRIKQETGQDYNCNDISEEDIARASSEEDRDKDEAQKEDMKKYLENQILDLEALTKALVSANDKLKEVIDLKIPEDGSVKPQDYSVAEAFHAELKAVKMQQHFP